MNRMRQIATGFRAVPWIVAGTLLLGGFASAAAQEATPASIEAGAMAEEAPAALPAGTSEDAGAGTPPTAAMPSAGVGSGLAAGGSGPFALGALVGALVAAGAALRERYLQR